MGVILSGLELNRRPVRAVIFDLDDTLIYTFKLKSFRENRDVHGLKANIGDSYVFGPVRKIISHIKEEGISLGLVTNSPRWYVDALLKHHELDVFDAVVTYDDVGGSGIKPSPAGINLVISKLEVVDLKSVIYIGDQDIDVEACYSAGVKPIVPSWATRRPVDQVPAVVLNSKSLISNFNNIDELSLIADRVALNKDISFPMSQMNFLPLDGEGKVVPLKKEDIKIISLGRYFSQSSSLTAKIHEDHALSKEIFKKETSKNYVFPEYYVDLFVKVVDGLPSYVFDSRDEFFDIVTVIPSKKDKNPRLENLLKRVCRKSKSKSSFIYDIFEFDRGSASLKTLGGKSSRSNELRNNFHLKEKYKSGLYGKTILVLDDIITTGATFDAAFQLLKRANISLCMGVCLAKTVSVQEQHKICPRCHRIMRVRRNGKTNIHFYSCTGYYESDQCKYSEHIKIKTCPKCGKDMKKAFNYKEGRQFLTCTSYGTAEACGYTESVVER